MKLLKNFLEKNKIDELKYYFDSYIFLNHKAVY